MSLNLIAISKIDWLKKKSKLHILNEVKLRDCLN